MAAEVRAPIVQKESGQEFLKSTSFQIGQDDVLTNNKMNSIFKSDYPPYDVSGRTSGAKPPPLSEVMHRDARFFNEKGSETTKSFEYRPHPKPEIIGASGKLRVTNFKMDRDLSKFNSFETVHSAYFTPKMTDKHKNIIAPTTRDSHIPQGDREKEPQPLTDYRDRFKGHDTNLFKTIRAPSMHEGNTRMVSLMFNSRHIFVYHSKMFCSVHCLTTKNNSSLIPTQ